MGAARGGTIVRRCRAAIALSQVFGGTRSAQASGGGGAGADTSSPGGLRQQDPMLSQPDPSRDASRS
jgi:hypothetical protein